MTIGTICTYTGKKVAPFDLKVEDIDPMDIAAGLSNICRYNGHVRQFYSVAQHSMIVADYCSPDNRKWALLHDASEAYIGDIVAPLKYTPEFSFYLELEEKIMATICERFDLDPTQPDEVTYWDQALRAPEMRDLKDYPDESAVPHIAPMPPQLARARYISYLVKEGVIDERKRYEYDAF